MWNQHNITLKRDGAKARRPLAPRSNKYMDVLWLKMDNIAV